MIPTLCDRVCSSPQGTACSVYSQVASLCLQTHCPMPHFRFIRPVYRPHRISLPNSYTSNFEETSYFSSGGLSFYAKRSVRLVRLIRPQTALGQCMGRPEENPKRRELIVALESQWNSNFEMPIVQFGLRTHRVHGVFSSLLEQLSDIQCTLHFKVCRHFKVQGSPEFP